MTTLETAVRNDDIGAFRERVKLHCHSERSEESVGSDRNR